VFTLQELVALEGQIGDVNTGLRESYIQENLRSTFYIPGAACTSDQSSELSVENDACIICQVNLLPCSLLNYSPSTL
jgi:E3 ubiquitin-protein ligase RNF38/44